MSFWELLARLFAGLFRPRQRGPFTPGQVLSGMFLGAEGRRFGHQLEGGIPVFRAGADVVPVPHLWAAAEAGDPFAVRARQAQIESASRLAKIDELLQELASQGIPEG